MKTSAWDCQSAMKSNRNLRLRTEAQIDIRSILRYTSRQWGAAQRQRYRRRLDEGLMSLTRHPEIGQERNDIHPGIRTFQVERHLIYYSVTETELVVSRVLHVNQDSSGKIEG